MRIRLATLTLALLLSVVAPQYSQGEDVPQICHAAYDFQYGTWNPDLYDVIYMWDECLLYVLSPEVASVAYNNRGDAYLHLGEYESAIYDFTEAIGLDPDALKYNNRCNAYGSIGEGELSIRDCNEAIRLDPGYSDAYVNRGITYIELGQVERGMQDFSEAIRVDPENASAYYNRGFDYYRKYGDHERAMQDFNEAIRLNPEYAVAYGERAFVLQELGRIEEAKADAATALELDPSVAVPTFE